MGTLAPRVGGWGPHIYYKSEEETATGIINSCFSPAQSKENKPSAIAAEGVRLDDHLRTMGQSKLWMTGGPGLGLEQRTVKSMWWPISCDRTRFKDKLGDQLS